MNRLALVLCLAAQAVQAQSLSDFRSSAELSLSARDALHRFTLPFEAYRDTRRDLGDLRVFNGQGEPVPFALAGEEDRPREAASTVALPQFPVFGAAATREVANLDVSVRTRADGAVISVQQRTRPAQAQLPEAWLLDASAVKSPLRALVVDWEAGKGTEIVRVNVEASDDLKNWQAVASQAVLVRVEQGGLALSQPRVELAPRQAKYLRLTGASRAFQLKGVRVESAVAVQPLPRATRTSAAASGAKPGEFVFDLGARLPVEAVRVTFPVTNSVAPVEVLSRDAEAAEWRPVASGTFYRLTREAMELVSPALEIGRRADRFWLLRIDPRTGGLGSAPPSLEVAWRAAQVVFVARGEPAFRVAFGRADAQGASLALAALMPGYETHAEFKLPVAQVGAVQSSSSGADGWRRFTGEVNGRKLALWAVLVVGVAVLGFMAWRLLRQMQAQPPESGS